MITVTSVFLTMLTISLSMILAYMAGKTYRVVDLYGNCFERWLIIFSMVLSCASSTICYVLLTLMLMGKIGDISISSVTEGTLFKFEQFMGLMEILPVLSCSTTITKHTVSEGRNADHTPWKLGNILIAISIYCNKEISTVRYIFKDDPDEPDEILKKIVATAWVVIGAGALLNMYIFEKFRKKE